jgi:putative ABC transport system substrate-binding protein
LRQLKPQAEITVLLNPTNPNTHRDTLEARKFAEATNTVIRVVHASNLQEIDALIAINPGAVLVGNDALFLSQYRKPLIALGAQLKVPMMYTEGTFVREGGLISYGGSLTAMYRKAGIYAGRILRGEIPSNLPVLQTDDFELIINLKTAKSLGLEIPASLLARADEVIE